MKLISRLSGGMCLMLVIGCASPKQPAMPARTLERAYTKAQHIPPASPPTNHVHQLSLETAVALALGHNPMLIAADHETQAAAARMRQAGAWKNPTLKVGLEAFDRDGAGMDSAEAGIELGQLIELGGKRKQRVRIQREQQMQTALNYEIARQTVTAETARRAYALAAAQAHAELAAHAEEIAQRMVDTVAAQVQAGKALELQLTKATAERELLRMKTMGRSAALDAARASLAAMWGASAPHFETVVTMAPPPAQLAALNTLRPRLDETPQAMLIDVELRVREAELAAQKAARIPDVVASLGFHHYEEDGTDALSFAAGIPLPLFDRNSGSINAAEHQLRGAVAEAGGRRTARATGLSEAYARLVTAHGHVHALTTRIVPAMERALLTAQEGYQHGKFAFMDVLDTQRSLLEARASTIEGVLQYHMARISVEALIAGPIAELKLENKGQ